jgi:hypothetical protein
MPQLFLAIEGKVDFVKKTNPFGAGPAKKKAQSAPVDEAKLSAQRLAFNLMKAGAVKDS